jgi:hypothetical protein
MPQLQEEGAALVWGETVFLKFGSKGRVDVQGLKSNSVILFGLIIQEVGSLQSPHAWPRPLHRINWKGRDPTMLEEPNGFGIARALHRIEGLY